MNRPLTLSPARGPAGRRKRCSCDCHRCPAQRPKMEPGPDPESARARTPSALVQPTAGPALGRDPPRRPRTRDPREGAGGGGPAHLDPPPRSAARVGVSAPPPAAAPPPLPLAPPPRARVLPPDPCSPPRSHSAVFLAPPPRRAPAFQACPSNPQDTHLPEPTPPSP